MNKQEIGTLAARLANGGIARAIGADLVSLPGDATIAVDKDAAYILNKAGVAAITLPAPGAENVGRVITFIAGTANAHVVTATAALANGTATKTTWTAAAFPGSSLTVRAISSTLWACVSNQLGAYA